MEARSCYHTWLATEQAMRTKTTNPAADGEHSHTDKTTWGWDEEQSFEKQEADDRRAENLAKGAAKRAEEAAKRAEVAISARYGSYQEEHDADQARLNLVHKLFLRGHATLDDVHTDTWRYVTKRYQRMSTTEELRIFKGTPLDMEAGDFATDLSIKLIEKVDTVTGEWAHYVNTALKNSVIDAGKYKSDVFKRRGALSALVGRDEDGTVFIGQSMTETEMQDEDNVPDGMRTVEFRAPRSSSVLPVDHAGASAPLPDAGAPAPDAQSDLDAAAAKADDLLRRAEDAVIRKRPEALGVFQLLHGGKMTQKEIAAELGLKDHRVVDNLKQMRRKELTRLQELARDAEQNPEHEHVTDIVTVGILAS